MPSKNTKQRDLSVIKKKTSIDYAGTDNKPVIWVFDRIDLNGAFAFDLSAIRERNYLSTIFDKMIQYEKMTWSEIKQQTHGRQGKSKHHYLNPNGISSDALERIKFMSLDEWSDSIFSFALDGKLRIIGYRDSELFHVVWFDPEHRFYPV